MILVYDYAYHGLEFTAQNRDNLSETEKFRVIKFWKSEIWHENDAKRNYWANEFCVSFDDLIGQNLKETHGYFVSIS